MKQGTSAISGNVNAPNLRVGGDPSAAASDSIDTVTEPPSTTIVSLLSHREGDLQRHSSSISTPTTSVPPRIDRIYYINMDKNQKRRELMEGWLKDQTIPYQRFSAMRGGENVTCKNNTKNDHRERCRGIAGVAMSNVAIMDQRNTTGLTLVLEDDYQVKNMTLLEESLKHIPSDFDVVRWDCWGRKPKEFQWMNKHAFRTACINATTGKEMGCSRWFCGGNHATLWRGGRSLQKLRDIWSSPYDGIDCLLTTAKLKSYCINGKFRGKIGNLVKVKGEKTDIPKVLD